MNATQKSLLFWIVLVVTGLIVYWAVNRFS
jgi:uncharacterized iron-regulated membrane protein